MGDVLLYVRVRNDLISYDSMDDLRCGLPYSLTYVSMYIYIIYYTLCRHRSRISGLPTREINSADDPVGDDGLF